MRILGHIHTFNDEDVIDRSLQALLDQTYPLEEILVLDNCSTDGTLNRSFPKQVTVIRHPENRGTSGAVVTGLKYALDKGYDWIWVLDGDSAPRPDALEALLVFHERLPEEKQEKVYRVSSKVSQASDGTLYGAGIIFTREGARPVDLNAQVDSAECHGTVWSGSLFKVEAIRAIGLPSPDYVLDWGEFAYSYQGVMKGYTCYVVQASVLDHNISGQESMRRTSYHFGPLHFSMFESPPIRCYYETRNRLYFWMYEFKDRNFLILGRTAIFVTLFTLSFLLRPLSHMQETKACLRGIWDGLWRNMHRRY